MKFTLVKKDYQREYYEAPFVWKGVPVTAHVNMQYHTFLHYWGVSYYISYPSYYSTPPIKAERFDGSTGRKDARKTAEKYMKSAKPSDVDKLDKFYQNEILKSKIT